MSTPLEPADHEARVRQARERLNQLEVEMRRMRAELLRLEAAGDESAAEQLEAELRQREGDFDRQKRATDGGPGVASPSEQTAKQAKRPAESKKGESKKVAKRPRPAANKADRPAARDKSSSGDTRVRRPDATAPERVVIAIDPDKQPPAGRRRLLRGMPAWAVSTAIHAVLFLAFGAWTFATVVQSPPTLQASAAESDDEFFDDLAEINFDEVSPEELELEEELTEFEPTEFETTEFDSPMLESETQVVSPSAFDSPPTDFGSLMTGVEAGGGAGEGRGGRSGGRRGGAQFFGAKSQGGRFAFLIDNSGSMRQGRMETTLIELQRAVGAMSDKQFFYVAFYSDQVYPMFFPQSVKQMVPATSENKRRLSEWLTTVEICWGGAIQEAFELAREVKPDVVFLLSDGGIQSSRKMEYLTESKPWEFSVNTLGMTVQNQNYAARLIAIAQANRGVYRPVAINPVAAQMAKKNPLPTNKGSRGLVWGTKVRVEKK